MTLCEFGDNIGSLNKSVSSTLIVLKLFRLPTLSLPFKRFGQDVDEAGFQHSVENISLEEASGRSVQGFENPTYDQPSVSISLKHKL